MPVDPTKLRYGVRVVLRDGSEGKVTGSYLSIEGLVLSVNVGGGIVDRNVRLEDVEAILAGPE